MRAGRIVTLSVATALAAGLCLAAPPAGAAARSAPRGAAAPSALKSFPARPFRVRVAPKVLHRSPVATPGSPAGSLPGVPRIGWSTLESGVVALGSPVPNPTVGTSTAPLTTFTKSFTTNGSTYRYRMVGTDPAGAAVTTTVPNVVVPVSIRVGGRTIAPSTTTISAVTGSGLFTPRAFPGSTGQYGDAFMRTQFWSAIGKGAKAWHVQLGRPAVQPWLVLDVPSGVGTSLTVNGVRVAAVDVDWFDAQVQDAVTAQAPGVLTQLLSGNVALCKPFTAGSLESCGIGGYHSATSDGAGTHTYSYQAYLSGAVFGAASGFHDLGPMSHELAEWFADPYADNVVPAWSSPLAPQYGCLDALESGDPVVGSFLTLNGLTYQDEAYLWWFARTSPSPAWQGRYTWLDTFSTVSPSCTP